MKRSVKKGRISVKIVFDKASFSEKFRAGWGLSVLIGGRILFDAGEKGSWLMGNLAGSGADINKIEGVIISHDHWDHTGGLWGLLSLRPGLAVYLCPNSSSGLKKKVSASGGELREIGEFGKVAEGIFVTGEVAGEYNGGFMPEQAAVVRTEKGVTMIAGCAHPGIVEMAEAARGCFPSEKFHMVMGGFHLLDKSRTVIEDIARRLIDMGVLKIAPVHCSGYEAEEIFREIYGENFVAAGAGSEIDV